MGNKKDKKGKKGGVGRTLVLFVVVVGAGVGAAFYLAPDFMNAQWTALRGMIGG